MKFWEAIEIKKKRDRPPNYGQPQEKDEEKTFQGKKNGRRRGTSLGRTMPSELL